MDENHTDQFIHYPIVNNYYYLYYDRKIWFQGEVVGLFNVSGLVLKVNTYDQ